MGLFDFIKGAGKTLGLVPEDKKGSEEKILTEVKELGLPVKNLEVDYAEGTIRLNGRVKNQELKERIILAVGNIAGVDQVEDNMEIPLPEPQAAFYTVKRGDSLSKISKTYYGNAMKYNIIFEANRPMLTHPDKIYPGQVLRIPKIR